MSWCWARTVLWYWTTSGARTAATALPVAVVVAEVLVLVAVALALAWLVGSATVAWAEVVEVLDPRAVVPVLVLEDEELVALRVAVEELDEARVLEEPVVVRLVASAPAALVPVEVVRVEEARVLDLVDDLPAAAPALG